MHYFFSAGGSRIKRHRPCIQPCNNELHQALHGPRPVRQRAQIPPRGSQSPTLHIKRPQPQALERQDRPLHRRIWRSRGS